MKILKKCPILVGVVVITIALSIVSLIFKDTVYAGYADKYESGDIPLFALAIKGAMDEVFPWSDIQHRMDNTVLGMYLQSRRGSRQSVLVF